MYMYLYTFKESGMQNCESACFNNYWRKKCILGWQDFILITKIEK